MYEVCARECVCFGILGGLHFKLHGFFFRPFSFVGRFEIRLLLVNPVNQSTLLCGSGDGGGGGGGGGDEIGRESLESLTIQ